MCANAGLWSSGVAMAWPACPQWVHFSIAECQQVNSALVEVCTALAVQLQNWGGRQAPLVDTDFHIMFFTFGTLTQVEGAFVTQISINFRWASFNWSVFPCVCVLRAAFRNAQVKHWNDKHTTGNTNFDNSMSPKRHNPEFPLKTNLWTMVHQTSRESIRVLIKLALLRGLEGSWKIWFGQLLRFGSTFENPWVESEKWKIKASEILNCWCVW